MMISVIIAMREEAEPIVEHYQLERLDGSFVEGAPMVAWRGTLPNGVLLHVVWCGHDERFGVNNVATTAAAVSAYGAVAAFGKPDLMISAGTAGGFGQRGAAVGDVFLSTKCVFHSRRIPVSGGTLEEYGFGHFRSPPLGGVAAAARLKQGVVTTSDSLDSTETDMELMMAEGAVVKEMECAAVAWVCEQLRVPFVALKSITDIVDGEKSTRDEFESNLRMASSALQARMAVVLELLGSRPLSAWASRAPANSSDGAGKRAAARSAAERPAGAPSTGVDAVGVPGRSPSPRWPLAAVVPYVVIALVVVTEVAATVRRSRVRSS